MSTLNDPAFDFDTFFDNISSVSSEETNSGQRNQEKDKINVLKKKIIKVHVAISKAIKLNKDLAEKDQELFTLRSNYKDLLEKHYPLEKKYDDLLSEFSKLQASNTKTVTELEALRCHSNQLQALVKDLESKNEGISIEKSIISNAQANNNKVINHVILFGKLAASQGRLSNIHLKILNKYLRSVGENDYESDKEIDNLEMPPSCVSVDTGVGSSLPQSEDEKTWSPASNTSRYEEAPVAKQIDEHSSVDEEINCPHTVESAYADSNIIKSNYVHEAIRSSHMEKKTANQTETVKSHGKTHMHTQSMECKISSKENNISQNPLSSHIKHMSTIGTNTTVPPKKVNSSTSPRKIDRKFLETYNQPKVNLSLSKISANPEKKNAATSPIKLSKKSRRVDFLFNHMDYTLDQKVACNDNSLDSEIENILKDMAQSAKFDILTPIPPTPVNVQRALKKISMKTTISCSNSKRSVKRSNPVTASLSKKIRKLELNNFKLNKVIFRQRRQLLSSNQTILKSRNTSLGSTEDDFVRLLSLMSKVSDRFNIQEKKSQQSQADRDSSSNGLSIFKKMYSLIEENVEDLQKGKMNVQKTSSEEVNSVSNCVDQIKLNNNTNDNVCLNNMRMVIQDEEISSAACLSQTSSSTNERRPTDEIHKIGYAKSVMHDEHQEDEESKSKGKRNTKMSKLGKLKEKLKRKSKIETNTTPPSKRKRKNVDDVNSAPLPLNSECLLNNSRKSAIEMNHKVAYDNAVKIMSGLKAQNNNKTISLDAKMPRLTRSSKKEKNNASPLQPSKCGSKIDIVEIPENILKSGVQLPQQNLQLKLIRQEKKDLLQARQPYCDQDAEPTSSRKLRTRKNNLTASTTINMKLRSTVGPRKSIDKIDEPTDLNVMEQSLENVSQELQLRTERLDYNDLDIFDDDNSCQPCSKIQNTSESFYEKSSDTSDNESSIQKKNCSDTSLNKLQLRNQHVPLTTELKTCSSVLKSQNSVILNKPSQHHSPPLNKSTESSADINRIVPLAVVDIGKNAISVEKGKSENNYFIKSMLAKYGVKKVSHNLPPPTYPENIINEICKQLESCLGAIIDVLPSESDLDALVARLETRSHRFFVAALMKFLMSPERDTDILCKAYTPPLPPMTKTEQALIYVLNELQKKWKNIDIIRAVMRNIEYKLFRLGHTPFVKHVENLSRFYAVLCRFRKSLSRLRIFIVDAMYCMNFRAIPLIKQCIEVWKHVLPLSNVKSANNPLVLTIIYLLFFFKNTDNHKNKNNSDVEYLKFLLTRRYLYKRDDFSENIIVDKLRQCIIEMKGKQFGKAKVLSTAFILLTKRNGVKWCQKKIIEGMLMPLIESESTPEAGKAFSITLLGSLLKPYPDNMRLHCEMTIKKLQLMREEHPSFAIEQAILITLILLRRHNRLRPFEILRSWTPRGQISSELNEQLRLLIREQPLKSWIKLLCDKNS